MKIISTALVLASLAVQTSPAQQVQRGSFSAGVESEGWSLNGGTGARVHLVFIKFPQAFPETPAVVIGLTTYDGAPAADGNLRVHLKAESIGRDGFVIKVSTWGESRITGVGGDWMAFIR